MREYTGFVDLANRAVWQQASGEPPRDYAMLCLRHGIILNGYDEEDVSESVDFDDPLVGDEHARLMPGCQQWIGGLQSTEHRKRDLVRFCHEMADGDVVVLRRGTSQVVGVGVVIGGYEWNPQYGDIDGWHLPLIRRVRWVWDGGDQPQQFAVWTLARSATTLRLRQDTDVWQWLGTLPEPSPAEGLLPQLTGPHGQKLVTIGEIAEYLFDQGVASSSIRHLVEEIGELERIAKWYLRTGDAPSESETIAYLVIPLLRALGWTPQRMAVEWHDIDVALFASLPRASASLKVVVEVKKLHSACLVAGAQANGYAASRPNCDRVILTNGLRYAVHTRGADGRFGPAAYLNLTRMRDGYPALGYSGAQEALRLMTP